MNYLKTDKDFKVMIKYHNDMNVVAFKKFNQRELNIFFSICAFMKDKGDSTITFSYDEIKQMANLNVPTNQVFEELLESTYDKLLQLKIGYVNKDIVEKFILFTGYKINKNDKLVDITINAQYQYILNELSKNFTVFELQEFNALVSSYSKNMFRLLKQYKSTGFYKVSIEEFRRLLDIPESYNMSKISVKVIDPIEKELSNYFEEFRVEKLKVGRFIKFLQFSFKPQHYKDNQVMTIDIKAENSHDLTVGEKRKEEVLCPKCGKPLVLLYNKNGDTFWGHADYLVNTCKETYSTKEEIETIKEQRAELLEDEADRAKFEQEVKELINQHKDIVNLIGIDKRYVCIEQVEQQDLFYQNPVVQIKINRNAIDTIKKYIETWSK
jgi:plasmid replication initiation protein